MAAGLVLGLTGVTVRLCRACRRPLRSPIWRARGVGPVCARKAGLVVSRRCATVLVWSARKAEPGEGQLSLFDDEEAPA